MEQLFEHRSRSYPILIQVGSGFVLEKMTRLRSGDDALTTTFGSIAIEMLGVGTSREVSSDDAVRSGAGVTLEDQFQTALIPGSHDATSGTYEKFSE
jgi:hypothetical protein